MGMNYYDPFLAAYLLGETKLASESLTVTGAFNRMLEGVYQRAGDQVADVQSAFQTLDTATDPTTGLPVDVELICQLTWMCDYSPPNIHPNTSGISGDRRSVRQGPRRGWPYQLSPGSESHP